MVRSLLGLPYKDTQCGGKVLKRRAVESIVDSVSSVNYAFDLDLLYRLHRQGFKIREVPVVWQDKEGSSVRLFRTSSAMFFALVRLRFLNNVK
ncbi:MAG: hypothetical protein M1308_18200 [Actinobacteria bacterium]|nr:hypothetical protein [Actinomycetota bacterium]